MAADALTVINTRRTPQSQPANKRQVQNNAGGYVFTVGDFERLRRFLVLGTTGGSYYSTERELTKANADQLLNLIDTRGVQVVKQIVEISEAGRAPKQQFGLFALAAVAGLGNDEAKAAAFAALPKVARTASTLMTFVKYAEQFRGWGPAMRKGVGRWYTDKDADELAYQVAKYQSRDGWSNRDLLRLAHPKPASKKQARIFDWIMGRPDLEKLHKLPEVIQDFMQAHRSDLNDDEFMPTISRGKLSWEMLPSEKLSDPNVWRALMRANQLPLGALTRQLPRLTRLGVLDDKTTISKVEDRLTNSEALKKARIHPINQLVALKTYSQGKSERGSSTWTPNRRVVDALDASFYAAYGAVRPSGKRILLALDVSGSMSAQIGGMPLSAREAVAAIALVTANVEKDYEIVAFTSDSGHWSNGWGFRTNTALTPLTISPRQRLDDVLKVTDALRFGGTDCALPFTWALEQGKQFDAVVILTDNESWAGPVHVHQALKTYRERVVPDCRLIVVGMTATEFTVADPKDPLSLNVVGFDSATPQIISDFAAGLI